MASGDTYAFHPAWSDVPPSSDFPTKDTTGGGVPVLDYDDSTTETTYYFGLMPGQ